MANTLHPSLEEDQHALSWKEPVRRRRLRWALRASIHPTILATNPPLHPGWLVALLFLLGGGVALHAGGSLPTRDLVVLSLAGASLLWVLPRTFSSAQITIRDGELIRVCGGCTERWAELDAVQFLETYRHGERRELLRFCDSQGREETILLPWRLERTAVQEALASQKEASSMSAYVRETLEDAAPGTRPNHAL